MTLLTVIALVIILGVGTFSRISLTKSLPSSPPTSPEIAGVTSVATSSPEMIPTPQASSSPTSSTKSKVEINVDTKVNGTTASLEKLIYPGASAINGNQYEVNVRGATVYDWYKSEMSKRNYQIRNNVKTQANEKFKGVLQGVSGSSSLKVTIDQENPASKTTITLE